MAESPESFADLLRRFRLEAGFTQEELATRSGMSSRGLSDLERALRSRPYLHTVHALADALALSAGDRSRFSAAALKTAPRGAAKGGFIPVPSTPLLGRSRESARLLALLTRGDARLVTLTGIGGVGKTRLAVEVARDVATSGEVAVYFVDLAPVTKPDDLVAAIAQAAAIRPVGTASPGEILIKWLQNRDTLLVLDNFEHLTAAAPVLSRLLASSERVRLLVTSRVPLHLKGENVFVVAPLAHPEMDGDLDAATLLEYPAVALLVERIRALDQHFALRAEDAATVARICARLDGLPLAIELAAAREPILGLGGLDSRLDRSLVLLTAGARDAPVRQQTMRNTIAWSYSSLDASERRALRYLAIFEGGWTASTAERLLRDCAPPARILDTLAALVDSSLIYITNTPGESRFAMLAIVREYLLEELRVSGEEGDARRLHLALFVELAAQAHHECKFGPVEPWRDRYPPELDNVRAAMQWALNDTDYDSAASLAVDLHWFFDRVGLQRESRVWAESVLHSAPEQPARAMTYWAAGAGAWQLGEFNDAERRLAQAEVLLAAAGDRFGLLWVRRSQGLVALGRHDPNEATHRLQEALVLARQEGDTWEQAFTLFLLADATVQTDPQAAEALYCECLTMFREVDSPWGVANAVTGLGGVAMSRRAFDEARVFFQEGLTIRRAAGHRWAEAISLASLAEVSVRCGDRDSARDYASEALELFQKSGDQERTAWAASILDSMERSATGERPTT